MLRPILFIGLGGAGGKTLRAIREDIAHGLETAGWQGNFPGCFQFLQIDIDDQTESDYLPPSLPADQFCKLVPLGASYRALKASIEARFNSESERAKVLGDWMSFEASPDLQRGSGAFRPGGGSGAIRPVGRSAFVSALPNVVPMLRQGVLRIQSKEASDEFDHLSTLICGESESDDRDMTPRVVIVSSLCGGTGSAIYVDILETLRRLVPGITGEAPVSLLYEADLFSTRIPGVVNSFLGSNMLATLDEIANFSINGVGISTSQLLERFAVPTANMDYRDKSSKIIIGAGPNAGSRGLEEVFISVGKHVAKVALSPENSENLFSSPLIPEEPNLSPQDHSGRVMALSSSEFSSFVWFLPGDQGYYGPLRTGTYSLGFEESTSSGSRDHFTSKIQALSFPERQSLARSSRARRLLESVPLSVDVITQLLAGWIIVGVFGLRKREEDWWVRNPYSADDNAWMKMSGVIPDSEMNLGASVALLSNFNFALELSELHAREYVLEVGSHVVGKKVAVAKTDIPETDLLRRFILGLLPAGTSIKNGDVDASVQMDLEDGRKELLIARLTRISSSVADFLNEEEKLHWENRSRFGEISERYLAALSLIEDYVANLDTLSDIEVSPVDKYVQGANSVSLSSSDSQSIQLNVPVKTSGFKRFLKLFQFGKSKMNN